MRSLVVSTFLTLDGVMQAPGGQQEDPSGDFALGGWTVPYFDDQVGRFMTELMTPPFDLVLGRRTYDIFAAYWPNAGEEEGAGPLNAATKYVASRGEPTLPWKYSVPLQGDVAAAVAALKAEDGPELQVHGSGDLLQTLIGAGLVDRYRLLVFPVLAGAGKRLFGGGALPRALRLLDSATSGSGVVMSTYEPVGEVVTGTFGT